VGEYLARVSGEMLEQGCKTSSVRYLCDDVIVSTFVSWLSHPPGCIAVRLVCWCLH